MRLLGTGLVIGAAMIGMTVCAVASPALSNELMLPLAGKVTTYIPSNENGGGVPNVTRGQALGVACADVNPGDDVRVIMKVESVPGEAPSDYDVVLATRQRVTQGAVHIRVPNIPALSQHTVKVKVLKKDSQGLHACDAGRVKIV